MALLSLSFKCYYASHRHCYISLQSYPHVILDLSHSKDLKGCVVATPPYFPNLQTPSLLVVHALLDLSRPDHTLMVIIYSRVPLLGLNFDFSYFISFHWPSRNFTGFHRIVLMYVDIMLLRDTANKSNRKKKKKK